MTNWLELLRSPEGTIWDDFGVSSYSIKFCADALFRQKLLDPSFPHSRICKFDSDNPNGISFNTIDSALKDLGLEILIDQSSIYTNVRLYSNKSRTSFCDIDYDNKEKNFNLSYISIDREFDINYNDYIKTLSSEEKKITNDIFVLIATPKGTQIDSIGNISEPLVRSNYSEKVLEGYDFILDNIGAEKPKGRLSILNGPPGVGKTHLIRGLIHEVKETCNFIMVSPDLVKDLTGPNFIKCLIGLKDPIVIVLEDADQCLTTKARDNMSEIQTILNFADGIIGQLIDLRIIVTSNVGTDDFDRAILRPGRLCRHLELGPLGADEANKLHRELGGEGEPFKAPATLAEVYGILSGVVEETKETRKIGF